MNPSHRFALAALKGSTAAAPASPASSPRQPQFSWFQTPTTQGAAPPGSPASCSASLKVTFDATQKSTSSCDLSTFEAPQK
ncbi:unnamed protein product [Closterium sp. Naga37s-1]|nr:unnamed protein product [Closterium sp. Naga37s-1]